MDRTESTETWADTDSLIKLIEERRPTVNVLMGGPDAERDVSLQSGAEIAAALRATDRFRVREYIINQPDAEALARLGGDVFFPALHGPWGEGGGLQELLEQVQLPYVGSAPGPAALAMDKMATKRALAKDGVATPSAQELGADEPCTGTLPLILKPVNDGSSVDLAVCRTDSELREARDRLHARRRLLMAEQFIQGREITIGIVDGRVLAPLEVLPADGLYDYDAKYERNDTRYVFDPDIPEPLLEQCRQASMIAYRTLGCRDVARVDFMVDDEAAWFLEINTMPGFTTHSLVPMAANASGLPMPDLCALLVGRALERGRLLVAARSR